MKNESFMTMFIAKGSELTKMNFYSLSQRRGFMKENLYYGYGGISAILFI